MGVLSPTVHQTAEVLSAARLTQKCNLNQLVEPDSSQFLMQEIMGVLIGSAVIPIALCLMWKKTNKWGAIAGAVLGQWCGLVAWVIFAKVWAALGFPFYLRSTLLTVLVTFVNTCCLAGLL